MNALEELIKQKIAESGPMCFSEFMELALYHPIYGYYMSDKHKIGKTGDFFTAPHVTNLFGRTIGKFIEKHFYDKPVKIIEFGAGNGWLAKDITDYLADQQRSYEYFIVEISSAMIENQKKLLEDRSGVKWVDSISALPEDNYLILANELLDAMPVHRVIKIKKSIQETKVGIINGDLADINTEPCQTILTFLEEDPEFEHNVIQAEINIHANLWIKNASEKLTTGNILVIDYGYTNKELSHYPAGTVNCFFEHTNTGNPYINIGLQDITSYVNFSPLIKYAESNGMNYSLTPQSTFLIENGIFEEQQKVASQVNALEQFKLSMSVKTLVMPNAMGERFKCLTVEKP